MQFEIRTMPEQRYIAIERRALPELMYQTVAGEAFTALWGFVSSHNLQDQWSAVYAFMPDAANTPPGEEQRYVASMALKEGAMAVAEGEVQVGTMPASRVVVFMHRGPTTELWKTWRTVYDEWLPASGETPNGQPAFENMIEDPAAVKPEDLRVEIVVPVV